MFFSLAYNKGQTFVEFIDFLIVFDSKTIGYGGDFHRRNILIFYHIFSFVLIQKKQKIKSWNFQRSITISNPKRKELATLKQLFFLRIFRLIDARFQIPRTVGVTKQFLLPTHFFNDS
jgi:hypothetical protein